MLSMVRSLKVAVVFGFAGAALDVPIWKGLVAFFIWSSMSWLEARLSAQHQIHAINAVSEDITDGWKPDADDPSWEKKEDWSRTRLTDNDQVVVGRLIDAIRRTAIASIEAKQK